MPAPFTSCDILLYILAGDDEQSDFYYEAGPTCGTPSIQSVLPWWDDEQLVQQQQQIEQRRQQQQQQEITTTEPQFEAIVTGSFQCMSTLAKQHFRHRLKMLVKVQQTVQAKFLSPVQLWNKTAINPLIAAGAAVFFWDRLYHQAHY